MIVSASFILLVFAYTGRASAFQLQRLTRIQTHHTTAMHPNVNNQVFRRAPPLIILRNENPNITPDDELIGEKYEGTVDWDAEWKKVVENRDQPAQRPGKYKSQVEINAIKATNKVAKNVFDASKEMNAKLPTIRSLQGDWKFWIGIIVIISFGLSILSVSGQSQVNESFYI